MTVTGRLELVALDAPDIDKLASFYAELAGWEIARRESDWIVVRTADGHAGWLSDEEAVPVRVSRP